MTYKELVNKFSEIGFELRKNRKKNTWIYMIHFIDQNPVYDQAVFGIYWLQKRYFYLKKRAPFRLPDKDMPLISCNN